MTVSIIIAVKTWQKNLEECINKCRELDFSDFEILVLPDSEIGTVPEFAKILNAKGTVPIRIIPTGEISPARKRDIALNNAKEEILAFIDDDAYPDNDWLKNAMKNFADPEVAAVGGPAVTPDEDNLMQKASGRVYSSSLVSGQHIRRYVPIARAYVDDYPSCNFLVRKSVIQELGGFKTDFWPGEDTKLCLEITQRLGQRIVYDPAVIVYHHRRSLFLAHLKQVASYALHRGYFVKRYPGNSFKFSYFLPSLLLCSVASGALLFLFLGQLRPVYLAGLSLYFLLVLIFSISPDLRLIPLVFLGTFLTHITYGFYFLKGLFSKRLKEEK